MRPPAALGSGPLIRLAGESGCAGLAVERGCGLGDLAGLAAQAFAAKLPLVAIVAPLPERVVQPHKRLPHLCAPEDRDERAAAVALVRRAIEAGRDHGTALFCLSFGTVDLGVPEPAVQRAFARRELGEDEPGHALVAAALTERRARSRAVLDACRAALEPIARLAERVDARLAILPAAGLWQAPSPREAIDLAHDFAGAPLGHVFSPARLAVLEALGLPIARERREALRRGAVVLDAADAVGLDHDVLPGLGEVDPADFVVPDGAPAILSGPPDTTEQEVMSARAALESRLALNKSTTAEPEAP